MCHWFDSWFSDRNNSVMPRVVGKEWLHIKQVGQFLMHLLSIVITEVKWKSLSPVWLFATSWTIQSMRNSPGQNTGVGVRSLLHDLPNPGIELRSLHCRQILYQLSHKGIPKILEWVAYPFSSGSSQPKNRAGVSCIADGFFTNWAMREEYFKKKVP